jgi:Mn2+/Fe2+ NRAMP family transporter
MSERIRHSLGPAIIIAAAVVGTGELIVAPRLGAAVGLSALWLIILGCVVKVFVQEELGRHTILTGDTMLEALNRVPGPAWRVSWATWSWLLLLFAGTLQMGGILVSLVQTLQLAHLPVEALMLALIVTSGTAAVLIAGRYKFIERASSLMVAGFTAMTVIALALLQRTEFSVSVAQILDGLKFEMPEHGFADAVAVFGITGIGTAELIFYPYWCLEKGYAKDLQAGVPREPSLVAGRIRGMRVDISIALVVYTFATLAFFILGATILHGVQETPKGVDMIRTLSQMYTRTFGEWVFYVFVAGAAVVLYSTFFVAMATWARLIADTMRLVSTRGKSLDHRRVTNRAIAALGVVYIALFLVFKQTPQWLIVGGGAIQTLLLPLFSIAVLFIRHRRQDEFRPGHWHDAALYLSVVAITCAAAYGLWGLLPKR